MNTIYFNSCSDDSHGLCGTGEYTIALGKGKYILIGCLGCIELFLKNIQKEKQI